MGNRGRTRRLKVGSTPSDHALTFYLRGHDANPRPPLKGTLISYAPYGEGCLDGAGRTLSLGRVLRPQACPQPHAASGCPPIRLTIAWAADALLSLRKARESACKSLWLRCPP